MSVLELQRSEGLELRLVEVHRKTKQKSVVPLPCPRPTHELIAAIQGKSVTGAQQQQRQQTGSQAAQRAPAPGHNASAHPPPSAGGAAGSVHPDRKRARSPGVKAEGAARRDVVDLSRSSNDSRRYRSPRPHQPAYEPLDRPPSPFLIADQKISGWLPDLRPNQPRERASPLKQQQQQQQSQQHRQAQQRDGRDKDRERDRDQGRQRDREQRTGGPSPGRPPRSQDRTDANRSASKSPHIRPSSHDRPRGSQRRSNSRDRQAQSSDAVSSVAASAVQPLSSPLEEGEVRLEPQALSTIREESSSEPPKSTGQLDLPLSTRMLLSPRAALAASGSLTKSCSSLTLSSLSVSSSSMHSRLHVSASMSDLSSVVPAAGGVDILAGDILRMSSSHSPSDSALSLSLGTAVVNEDDIMREIHRGKSELQCDHDEQIDEEEEQRHAKRARIGTSHPTSPDASHRDFESSTHVATETSAPAAASTDMDSSATAATASVAAETSSAEIVVPPASAPAASSADAAAAAASAVAAAAAPAPSAAADGVSAPMDVDVPVAPSAPVDVGTERHSDEKKTCEDAGAEKVHAAARADASPLKQATADAAAAAADVAGVPDVLDAVSLKQSPSESLQHSVGNGHALLPEEHKTAMETTLN